jgi:dTDP-4-amino-4,6-dideoxygalactose transaminase
MNRPRIPLARPWLDDSDMDAVAEVLRSGMLVQGPRVAAFEAELAGIHHVRHCVVVSSGTAALHVAYLSMGFGPGDALFVPSYAWPSAANVAVMVGARPVFVDVDQRTYNMSVDDLESKIEQARQGGWGTPRAIIPVHEFGLAADMDAITAVARKHRMLVVEDAACALGATYHGQAVGAFGSLAILSFHPRKAVTTGEGGAILTNDDELAEKCRSLRNHGQVFVNGKRDFAYASTNYRMTEMQAAMGLSQLRKLTATMAARREAAARYDAALDAMKIVTRPALHPEHTWQTYMVVLSPTVSRDAVVRALLDAGIESGPGAIAGHALAVYRQMYGYAADSLPVSNTLDKSGLALPLYHGITSGDTDEVCRALREAVSR